MPRYGLALSGGGFRAVLYHLGVVRLLRDAGLLNQITHITSVSGGSVLGAHLVLNWDRYTGSDQEFQEVTDELLQFLQLDIRNRIVRRFPFASTANMLRRTFRLERRRVFTRAGLLEHHYQRYLYGDVGLFNLPESPRLYILATNLSEGSLCAFYRDGMMLQRRTPGEQMQFESIPTGLATVPMAVAASSAFPGFFPPLELRSSEVGAREGEFGRQSFTDGGIYDNIGLRMFRHIQQSTFRDIDSFELDDVVDENALVRLLSGNELPTSNSPHSRLVQRLDELAPSQGEVASEHKCASLIERLATVIETDELYRDPVLRDVKLSDPTAQLLLHGLSDSSEQANSCDQIWLNRQIVASVMHQEIGHRVLRTGHRGFDGVMVSDAGATFKVRSEGRAGGLLSTAMRSTDILMDRVNQMELESFRNTPGVLFFPITRIVDSVADPYAPHREIQRNAALIRTDMDRFSDLEISALVQHGYCVARQACREESSLDINDNLKGAPWEPVQTQRSSRGPVPTLCDEKNALQHARTLQKSSSRRIVSTLVSWRDWPSYIWVPLVAWLVCVIPYSLYESRRTAVQHGYVVTAVAETSPVYRRLLELIDGGPVTERPLVEFDEVDQLQPPNSDSFEVLSDDRIFDLRNWTTGSKNDEAYAYSRLHVRRKVEATETHIRLQAKSRDPELDFVCREASLFPRYRRMTLPDGNYHWEIDLDFSRIPHGGDAEVVFDGHVLSERAATYGDEGLFQFAVMVDTALLQIWMLMPDDRGYKDFTIRGYPIGEPEMTEVITPTNTVQLPIGAIAVFQLINPRHDYRYECRWTWTE